MHKGRSAALCTQHQHPYPASMRVCNVARDWQGKGLEVQGWMHALCIYGEISSQGAWIRLLEARDCFRGKTKNGGTRRMCGAPIISAAYEIGALLVMVEHIPVRLKKQHLLYCTWNTCTAAWIGSVIFQPSCAVCVRLFQLLKSG
jgi:hypothetical protein